MIGTTLYTIGVLMALVTTLMATPMLALISPLYHRGMTAAPESEGTAVTITEYLPAPRELALKVAARRLDSPPAHGWRSR